MQTFGLTVDQVSKTINDKTIVHPFSLRIEPGEVVALCGGNGAGKSTILRMLVGILRPTTGTIQLNGMSWEEQRVDYLQQIGYMPDHFSFTAGLTARETLEFYAALRNRTAEDADRMLKAVGLHDARNKRVSHFSKGMQQRLLFAQAILANRPWSSWTSRQTASTLTGWTPSSISCASCAWRDSRSSSPLTSFK